MRFARTNFLIRSELRVGITAIKGRLPEQNYNKKNPRLSSPTPTPKMRTTLFLSAALAALTFTHQASAVTLAPTEPHRATALSQSDAVADAFLDTDTNDVSGAD